MIETKTEISQAALKLFTQHGFDAVSMSDIAKLANKNKATIYHYFASKELLYNEVFSEVLVRFNNALRITSNRSALLKIKTYIEILLEMDLTVLKLIVRQQMNSSNGLNEINSSNLKKLHATLEKLYKEAIVNENVKVVDPLILFEVIFGAVTQFRFSMNEKNKNKIIFTEELYGLILLYCSHA